MNDRALLVRAAREGDVGAFSDLVDMDGPLAYRLALVTLQDPLDAEDALQEAITAAWQRLPSLRDPDRWRSWFLRIAVRSATNTRRRRQRSTPALLQFALVTNDMADDVIIRQDLLAALRRLSASDRSLLALRFGADLTIPDTAETLGIPEGTVKSRLHRALRRLKTILEVGNGS